MTKSKTHPEKMIQEQQPFGVQVVEMNANAVFFACLCVSWLFLKYRPFQQYIIMTHLADGKDKGKSDCKQGTRSLTKDVVTDEIKTTDLITQAGWHLFPAFYTTWVCSTEADALPWCIKGLLRSNHEATRRTPRCRAVHACPRSPGAFGRPWTAEDRLRGGATHSPALRAEAGGVTGFLRALRRGLVGTVGAWKEAWSWSSEIRGVVD